MKKVILLLLSACSIFACTHTPKWELVWEDNFDGAEPDTSVWSRIPRGKPDWQNTQSFDDRCYEMRNGLLILKGIVNDNTEADAAQYLTGGLWTKDKRAFHGGRIEVRARLHGAKGAWPAIWTLPYETDKYSWPMGGEVDIMDRLNQFIITGGAIPAAGIQEIRHTLVSGAVCASGIPLGHFLISPCNYSFTQPGKTAFGYPHKGVAVQLS
mgnify:CR=1 FL=1